jgi:hypothetical protein
MGLSISNSGKRSPRWFRILKKVLSNTENTVLGILLIMGYSSDAPAMLIYKLASSFIMNNLDTILAEPVEPPADDV